MATAFTPLGKENAKHKGVLIWDFEDWQRLSLSKYRPTLTASYSKNGKQKYYCKLGKRNPVKYLHKIIMWCPDNYEIDHINGNGLDNRKKNLRIVSRSENLTNGPSRSVYGAKGLDFHKNNKNPWRAYIDKDNKRFSLGYYLTKEEAIIARLEGEKKYYPEMFK